MGELVVRAPWLTPGYFKLPEKSEELWRGGWLHTGDIAYRDDEGYIVITDRLKDVIKTGGEWISSLDLESMISLFEPVAEVAVIGVPDAKWGERPGRLTSSSARRTRERSARSRCGRTSRSSSPPATSRSGRSPSR